MKLALAGLLVVFASCLPDSRSGDFTCSVPDDCEAGRTCEGGFCIKESCPGDCDSCDTVAKTCAITCNGNACRNGVTCPAGYACTIACPGNNACGNVNCLQATSCDITCTAGNACGTITCGPGACDVTCTDLTSCDAVQCGSSCRCDVTCPGGDCATTCPGNDTCTIDGTSATACESSSCASC